MVEECVKGVAFCQDMQGQGLKQALSVALIPRRVPDAACQT